MVKNERGTILLENEVILDDTIPRKMNRKDALLSRLGICTVLRPHQIRKGKILDGKIGTYKIDDELSFIDFKNDKKKVFRKLLLS